jgi:hypothetical protein
MQKIVPLKGKLPRFPGVCLHHQSGSGDFQPDPHPTTGRVPSSNRIPAAPLGRPLPQFGTLRFYHHIWSALAWSPSLHFMADCLPTFAISAAGLRKCGLIIQVLRQS